MWHERSQTDKIRHDLVYLFIFALTIRFCFMAYMLGQVDIPGILTLTPDSIRYVNMGNYIAGYGSADEGAVLIFGPGYGIFLGIFFLIFGINGLPVLIFQAILSSITCLIIYSLAREVIEDNTVGYMAAILSALSITSISLGSIILSDSLFLFLFAWGNLVFIRGLRTGRISNFVISGLIIAAAIATRTMAQFWPLVMLAMVFLLPCTKLPGQWYQSRLGILKKAWIAPAIALLFVGIWIGRNYAKHDLPATALAGSHGLARLSAMTVAYVEDRVRVEVWDTFVADYQRRIGKTDLSAGEQHTLLLEMTKDVMSRYPGKMVMVYFGLMWKNATSANQLYTSQLPADKDAIYEYFKESWPKWWDYLTLFFTISGFVLLAAGRRWRPFVYLGLMYLYLLAMLGFGHWQGSRLFFPGQIVWTITIGYMIVTVVRSIRTRLSG